VAAGTTHLRIRAKSVLWTIFAAIPNHFLDAGDSKTGTILLQAVEGSEILDFWAASPVAIDFAARMD
jgi:hypothetical protein